MICVHIYPTFNNWVNETIHTSQDLAKKRKWNKAKHPRIFKQKEFKTGTWLHHRHRSWQQSSKGWWRYPETSNIKKLILALGLEKQRRWYYQKSDTSRVSWNQNKGCLEGAGTMQEENVWRELESQRRPSPDWRCHRKQRERERERETERFS